MSKKSIIPPNAQIPVAVVLGIFFILLLVKQFGPWKGDVQAEMVLISSGETEVEVSLDDLRKVLAEIRTDQIKKITVGITSPPLQRNPFQRWADIRSNTELNQEIDPTGTLEKIQGLSEDNQQASRLTRLESLNLSATSITDKSAIALINGQHFKPGNKISGFVIVSIMEREVILEDDYGTEHLRMAEVPSL